MASVLVLGATDYIGGRLLHHLRAQGHRVRWPAADSNSYPRRLTGLTYCYGVYPLHAIVFSGLARSIARRAEQENADRDQRPG